MFYHPPGFASGIFYDVPAAEYHRAYLDVANNSGLKVIDERTPLHYKTWVEKQSGGKGRARRSAQQGGGAPGPAADAGA